MNQRDKIRDLSGDKILNRHKHSQSEGFLDWGGGGGGITEFLYEPGLSPLSEVLERDQSEVEP